MAFQLDTLMQLQLSLNKADVTHIVVYLCGCEGQLNFTRNKQHRWMPIILYHTHRKDPGHLQQLYLSFLIILDAIHVKVDAIEHLVFT